VTGGDWFIYGKLDFPITAVVGGGTVDGTTHLTDDAVITAVNTALGL